MCVCVRAWEGSVAVWQCGGGGRALSLRLDAWQLPLVPRPAIFRMAQAVPTTMTGVYLPGDECCQLQTVPVPRPGPGQVLLKVHASSICGSDIRVIYGKRDPAQCEQVPLPVHHHHHQHHTHTISITHTHTHTPSHPLAFALTGLLRSLLR